MKKVKIPWMTNTFLKEHDFLFDVSGLNFNNSKQRGYESIPNMIAENPNKKRKF